MKSEPSSKANSRPIVNSIRAFLFDTNELLYPDSYDAEGLSVFFGVLAGYDLKGKKYEINYGTGEYDREGDEIFTGDTVNVYFHDGKDLVYEPAFVFYDNGCYSVGNENGLDVDVGSCILDEQHFVAITGTIYESPRKVLKHS